MKKEIMLTDNFEYAAYLLKEKTLVRLESGTNSLMLFKIDNLVFNGSEYQINFQGYDESYRVLDIGNCIKLKNCKFEHLVVEEDEYENLSAISRTFILKFVDSKGRTEAEISWNSVDDLGE